MTSVGSSADQYVTSSGAAVSPLRVTRRRQRHAGILGQGRCVAASGSARRGPRWASRLRAALLAGSASGSTPSGSTLDAEVEPARGTGRDGQRHLKALRSDARTRRQVVMDRDGLQQQIVAEHVVQRQDRRARPKARWRARRPDWSASTGPGSVSPGSPARRGRRPTVTARSTGGGAAMASAAASRLFVSLLLAIAMPAASTSAETS
jgi:hypothetical protein